MFHSIRWRLVASYLLLTILTVSMMGFLGLSLVRQQIAQREIDHLTDNANAVARRAALVMQTPFRLSELQELAHTSAFLTNSQVKILDRDQTILADSGPRQQVQELVWIVPPAGLPLAVEQGNQIFGPILVAVPASRASQLTGPEAGLLFLMDQMPPGTEFTVVQRRTDLWGGRVIFDVRQLQDLVRLRSREPESTSSAAEGTNERPQRPQRVVRVPIGDTQRPVGYVELRSGVDVGAESLDTTRRAFLLAGLGAALMALIVGLIVSSGLAAPIRRLTAAASCMAGGDLSTRAPQAGKDEIGQLSRQFNLMAERLEASFAALAAERDALRRFIADASHELRTPITALKNFNELLQGPAANDPEAQAEFLAESQTQINRLEWITNNLLDLSRLDAGLIELDLSPHDVGDLLEAAASPFKPLAKDKGVELAIQPPDPPLTLTCDRARLELALSNLLDNALKYTPAGGHITAGAQRTEQTLELWVEDDGPGIDPLDQSHIFERFYRGRESATPGTGLGLAIVKGIIQAHDGQVAVTSSLGEGSRFTITLPLG